MATNKISSVQRQVARVVYRSLLRTSVHGTFPELFGAFANKFSSLPSKPNQVRLGLKEIFRQEPQHTTTLFAALRRVNELSSILNPQQAWMPASLPIFDFNNSAAVTGEELQFTLFEPRYKYLVKEAMNRRPDDAHHPGGHGLFLLRARPFLDENPKFELVVLMKILQHTDLDGENIGIQCVAGPRVQVMQQENVDMDGAPPLKMATGLTIDQDDDDSEDHNVVVDGEKEQITNDNDDDDESIESLRARCLQLLSQVTPLENILRIGLPPIDPERFSFWLLRFVLAHNDVSSRHKWLACRSTRRRLHFVHGLLDKLLAFQKAKQEEPEEE
jgi:hypothetical protein